MKISDDYGAKYRLWARNPRVISPGPPTMIPGFRSRRFSSHAEMNAWKVEVLRQFAHRSSQQRS